MKRDELSTPVAIGVDEGLSDDSSIHCDALMSLQKSILTRYVSSLPASKLQALNKALLVALDSDADLL